MNAGSSGNPRRAAWRFVVALGIVSLFADMTYEGARSIVGPYLGSLGASALVAGVVGGGAEFLGYAVRWLSGRRADAGGRYWPIMYFGYALNLLCVPFLALTTALGPAAALVVGERLGKGVRTPARDALIARAGAVLGHGKSFGVHEFLDQAGALTGPLIVAALVAVGGYRAGFAVLAVPAAAALATLVSARRFEARPAAVAAGSGRLPRALWGWVAFTVLATAGYGHFTLVSFHLAAGGMPAALIPVLFALAMGAEGLAALLLGHLADRRGPGLLVAFPLFGVAGLPLLFLGGRIEIWIGAVLWGAGLGVQSSLLRAQVARLVPEGRRAQAFGLVDAATGVGWLAGSAVLGALYDSSVTGLVAAALALELAAVAWLGFLLRRPVSPESR